MRLYWAATGFTKADIPENGGPNSINTFGSLLAYLYRTDNTSAESYEISNKINGYVIVVTLLLLYT